MIRFFRSKRLQEGFIRLSKRTIAVYLMTTIILTGSGLLYLFNPFVSKTEAAWFDDNWAYRKSIVITNNTTAENNVKATLSAYDASDTNKFQSDCGDVRFVKQNGDLLDYTVTSCGASTSFDIVFDTLAAGANIIYLYYGNPSAVNGFLSSTSAAACTNCSVGTPASEEKGTGPTLAWHFDDPAISSTIQDASQNNLDGTLNNTPAWQTEGMCIAGKCYLFDGSSNESVSKSDDAKLDFVAADNFTVQAWVKRNGAASANTIVLGKASANIGSTYQGYKLYMDASGDFCFDTQDGTLAVDTACTSAVEFDDEKWHFVQGVKTGTTKIELYVDGKLRASDSSIASTGSLANAGTFYVGIDSDGLAIDWKGFIDEVKVYPYARSASQIQNDFTAKGSSKGTSVLGAKDTKFLSEGLVGYWKEDHTTAGTAATDSSGNGQTLTDSGTVSYASAKFGNGADFENSSADQFQYLADNSTLSITGSLTLSTWIKPEIVTAGRRAILAKWDLISAVDHESYSLTQEADEIRLSIDATANYVETSATNLSAGTWYHVVGVYNASSATAKIYINGVEATTTSAGTIPSSIGDDSSRFHIGGEDSQTAGAASEYDGIIDEARVYNRALSPAEVLSLYNFAPGPVGYWDFNENTGSTAYDTSGNANNGSISGASWSNGKFGAGLDYDGSDDVTTVTNATAIDLNDSLTGFTMEAWVFADSAGEGSGGQIFQKGTNTWLRVDTLSGSNLDVEASVALATTNATLPISTAITTKTWNHIALVYEDDSDDEISIYVNGVLKGTSTDGNGAPAADANNLLIGGVSTDNFDGKIDNVAMYGYPRSAKQVVEDMNAGHAAVGSPVSSAMGYWKFDEGAQNTCSGGSNDACNSGSSGTTLDAAFSTTTAAPAYRNDAMFGKSLGFDGGDFISGSDSTFPTGTNPSSMSLWFKTSGTCSNTAMFAYGSQATGQARGLTCTDATTITFFGWSADATFTVKNTAIGWRHVVGVFDGANAILYYDGKLIGSTAVTWSTVSGGTFYIGQNINGGNDFSGAIDEVKLYNYALSSDEIKTDYNRGASVVLGTLSTLGTTIAASSSATAEFCIPGSSATCTLAPGQWKLDENTGTTAYDSSTYDNNLTLTNTPTWTTGKFGSGINFAGSNQHLTRADDADFDFGAGASFSLETWFKHDTAAAQEMIIVKYSEAGYKLLMESDGDITCGIDYDSTWTPTDSVTSTAATYDDNKWHHLACVKNANTSLTLYIDGVSVGTPDTALTNSTLANSGGLYVGIDSDAASNDLIGQLDQILIYDYARSAAQVAWDYNKGAPIGWWKMDECQGTTINDSSGNANAGTWSGTAAGTNTASGDCTTVNTAASWYNGRNGKINASLDFDGTDDQVSIGTPAIFNDLKDRAGFSAAAWVYPRTEGENDRGAIISKVSGASNGWSFKIPPGATTNGLLFSASGSTEINRRASSSTLTLNAWNHAVVTWDGSLTATNIHIYVNGKEASYDGNKSDGVALTSDATNAMIIGENNNGATAWNGFIDDVRVYSYVLTAEQIKILYTGGAARYAPVTGTP